MKQKNATYKYKYLDFIPKNWKLLKDATTQPKGYKWYWNGKSLFSKEFKAALIKDGSTKEVQEVLNLKPLFVS